jgi:hypothetical protein
LPWRIAGADGSAGDDSSPMATDGLRVSLKQKKLQPPARESAGRLKTKRKGEGRKQSSKPNNRAMDGSQVV